MAETTAPPTPTPDVTATAPTAQPTTPDYSSQPAQLSAPAPAAPAPTQPAQPSGPPVASAPASAATGSMPGVHGILGSVVVGALKGVAQHLAKGVGKELNTFARQSPYGQELQKNALARQQAQQTMQLQQKQEQREEEKEVDAHTEAQLRTNSMTLDNLHKVHENEHIEAMYPGEEAIQRNTLMTQLRDQNAADRDLLSTLQSMGVHVDTSHGTGHDGLTSDHAKDVATGKVTMLNNGKEGPEAGYGFVDNTELQNTVLPSDVKVISDWDLDSKTGKMTPVYTTLSAGHNTAFDALITHDAASKKFQTLQDQYGKQLANKKSEADISEKQGATAKDYADAKKANAEALQAGAGITDANKGLTGELFVNTLPTGMQDLVRGIGKYQVDSKDLPRGKEKLPIMEAALHAYGPAGWSEAKYDERRDYLKEYGTSTKGDGATRNRLNTAIGHLDMLGQASEALTQSNIPKINQIASELGVAVGQSPKLVVDAIAEKAAGEVAGAIKGGGQSATDPAIEQSLKGLALPNMSPQQRANVLRAQFGILNTQVGTIAGKFRSTMGTSPDEFGQPVLYGNSQQILNKWTSGGGGSQQVSVGGQQYPLNPDGTFTVNGHNYKPSPDGKTATLAQ